MSGGSIRLRRRGLMLVLSSPSGAGKSTIANCRSSSGNVFGKLWKTRTTSGWDTTDGMPDVNVPNVLHLNSIRCTSSSVSVFGI